MKKALSTFFLLIGLTLLVSASYLFYLRFSSHPLSFEGQPQKVRMGNDKSPKSIIIPSISLNLAIIPATVTGSNWETTSKGISYLSTSPMPGEKGNSVMYGHNWLSILGNLSKVKPGQKIIVVMHNGLKKEFIVEYTAVVDPSQTYIIDNTPDTRLTLYTCTGFLDLKRFVVVAKPTV